MLLNTKTRCNLGLSHRSTVYIATVPRKYKAKQKNTWTDNALKQAVNESIYTGISLQNLKEKYSITRFTLHLPMLPYCT